MPQPTMLYVTTQWRAGIDKNQMTIQNSCEEVIVRQKEYTYHVDVTLGTAKT